jgi:hypothetical protein
MNVYWCGCEDIDFALGGNGVGNNITTTFDTAWSRANISTNAGSTTWPLTNYASNPASFGNISSFWVHDEMYFTANTTSLGGILFALADSGGVARILIRGTGTAGQLKISSRNAAGTIADFAGASTASAAFASTTLTKVDLFVNYAVSGQVQLYINGVVAADTGAGVNVTTDSATSLSFLYISSALTSSAAVYSSQVIVADSDTRACGLWTMNSTTAGNAQTWSGTASNVNKAIISDTTFISAANASLINEYRSGGIALPAGTYTVAAVKMSLRAQGGSTGGPTRVEYVTRVGSTDYVGGVWTPLTGSFSNDTQNYLQAINPGTSAAWTTADLTAATFNYGVESVA